MTEFEHDEFLSNIVIFLLGRGHNKPQGVTVVIYGSKINKSSPLLSAVDRHSSSSMSCFSDCVLRSHVKVSSTGKHKI